MKQKISFNFMNNNFIMIMFHTTFILTSDIATFSTLKAKYFSKNNWHDYVTNCSTLNVVELGSQKSNFLLQHFILS